MLFLQHLCLLFILQEDFQWWDHLIKALTEVQCVFSQRGHYMLSVHFTSFSCDAHYFCKINWFPKHVSGDVAVTHLVWIGYERWPQYFSVVPCGMREAVFVQTAAEGQVGGAHTRVRPPLFYSMETSVRHARNQNQGITNVRRSTPQESTEKETIFHWCLGQPITAQVTSAVSPSQPIRREDELTLLSYLAPYLLLWMYTHAHTHTEATSQRCLEADDRIIFAILELWHLAGIRSIINNSPAQQRESVSDWGSAHERRRTSARIAACAVTICSLWIFGEPAFLRPPPPAWRLCFLEEARVCVDFYRTGTWCFSCAPFALNIFSCRKELWAVFLFLGCLVLSPSGAGYKHLPFSFWIYFLDLSVCLKQIICFLCPGDI